MTIKKGYCMLRISMCHLFCMYLWLHPIPIMGMKPTSLSDVFITTSDKKEYTVPRWQIRESNTLYTLFLEKLQKSPNTVPVRISIPTVSLEEIELYSTALKQKNFD